MTYTTTFSYLFFRPHIGFDKGSLERLEKIFKETVGNEKEIRKEDFTKIVNSKNVSLVLLILTYH